MDIGTDALLAGIAIGASIVIFIGTPIINHHIKQRPVKQEQPSFKEFLAALRDDTPGAKAKFILLALNTMNNEELFKLMKMASKIIKKRTDDAHNTSGQPGWQGDSVTAGYPGTGESVTVRRWFPNDGV